MTVTQILIHAIESDRFDETVHLRLTNNKTGMALEIERGETRHALPIAARDLNDIADAIHVMKPARGKQRVNSRRLQFLNGTLVITYDNRGDPYREGLDFAFESDEPGRAPSIFLETRELEDFHAGVVKILKSR